MGKYDNLTTIADYAKKVGVTPSAVGTWLEEYNKTSDSPVNPVLIAGNTRLFEVEDLERVEAEKGKVGQAIRERGYVHPEKHAELESRYWIVVQQSAETQTKLNDALAELEVLRTSSGDLAAGVVNALRMENDKLTSELIAANERIEEQAQSIKDQNAVIVRASVENNELVKQNDELRVLLAKAQEKNDALILENISKQDRITELKNELAHANSQTVPVYADNDEKLSDAYAEIQQLKEKLTAAEAYSNSIITGESV